VDGFKSSVIECLQQSKLFQNNAAQQSLNGWLIEAVSMFANLKKKHRGL
jgi:1,2-phenylacetyl-CoA epoxidase catalytic subunit